MRKVRIVMISDTHTMHDRIKDMPSGDILLHAGDITYHGEYPKLLSFSDWLDKQDFKHKIIIPGNHDKTFERDWDKAAAHIPAADAILNQEMYMAEGLQVWGEPRQPWFHDWAFNIHRHVMKAECWDKIPRSVDIVVTHGPPYGYLDRTASGEQVGCKAQLDFIREVQPRLMVCGHIHEGRGMAQIGNTLVVNASICNLRYNPVNEPIVLDLEL